MEKKNNNKKILIIEDETVAQLLKTKLEQSGFSAEVASDGAMAFKKLDESIPDIILLDILMPIMNGLEFLENMRQDSRFKNIPVIVFSNFEHEKYAKLAKDLGALEYVIKVNVTIKQLIDKVKKYLANIKK